MDVTILGTGNMARGIATRLLAGGNNVRLLGTERAKADELAAELREHAAPGARIATGTSGDPLADDVVVLAVYYPDAGPLVAQYADQLAGKILIDITNPLNASFDDLATPIGSAAAEELARLAPEAKVVKAFNTTFAGTLVAGEISGQPLDVLIAADDADAKATVADLVEAGGLRAIDAGPLRRAQQLEGLGLLHIALQSTLGTGFGSAIKILA